MVMTMRMAVIDGQSVINVIEADEDFTLEGFTLVESDVAGPGWTYDGSQFTAPSVPPTEVPESITPRQARLALHAASLLDDVEAAVAAADKATQIAWDYAVEIRRDNPIITLMASQLGMPSQQVDDLFRAASVL